ncbi:MAG: cell division protein FtsZ [Candidatus Methanoperedens sp.]|nr:cell division protein FtsZ [Candidatus Methanoperedens sp.]MCZ7360322.1 cell division protein FtsZ [Candidatus Methanoperedens sp.]
MADLTEVMRASRPTIAVIGLGGAGCNITTYLSEKGVAGARIIAANADINHLVLQRADRFLLLGKETSRGKGCGGFPEVGMQCARESEDDIKKELEGCNILFIVAGLGGGTGTGSAPAVAKIADSMGILTIACLTMPFEIEYMRRENAKSAVRDLEENCDSVVLIDNTRLRKVAGNLPLKTAFAVANGLIGSLIKSITETITVPSLMNLDFADLKTVLEEGGISSFGVGEAEGNDRVEKGVMRAISTPLLDTPDISSPYGLLVSITGGGDMTLDEVAKVGELMAQHVPNTKRIIWGAKVDDNMTGRIRIITLFSSIGNPFD